MYDCVVSIDWLIVYSYFLLTNSIQTTFLLYDEVRANIGFALLNGI